MSVKHPIIAVTGSSGAGTTTVRLAFEHIFRREGIKARFVEGNSFRRFDRQAMRDFVAEAEHSNQLVSHFSPQANLLDRLEGLFMEYGRTGTGMVRDYVEDEALAKQLDHPCGTFTPWQDIPTGTDLLFYEGMHGGYATWPWTMRAMGGTHNPAVVKLRHLAEQGLKERPDHGVDIARWTDLLIGVTPIVNLEWIQKVHRDVNQKGASREAVTHTVIRRMSDYVHFITPQFSYTDINFQRVPLVDTSDPFQAKRIPTADESVIVIRFREPKNVDFPALVKQIDESYMSRRNTLVAPGKQMGNALELICTSLVHEMMERRSLQGEV